MKSTIDHQEINKFAQHAAYWWDNEGPLKTLHDINNARLNFIKDHAILEGSTVLDVGCGGGILCEALAKAGSAVIGIDAAHEAIEVAKEHALANGLSIDYQCSPIEHYDCAEGFDVITCMEMLEHVHHPEMVIAHCKRLLKPGGLLFLSTISRTLKAYTSAILAAEYVLGILPKQTHEYSKFIKPSELAAMARSVDLSVMDIKGLSYNPLSRASSLSTDVSVNYLLVLRSGEGA